MKPPRSRLYLAWIRTLPCIVCGSIRGIEASHTGPHGLSQKSSDYSATRRIPQLHLLATSISSWNVKANHDRTSIHWKFTRKAARTKFGYKRNTSKRSET
jgi:hypothetical protein